MSFLEVFAGGKCEWSRRGGARPRFTFIVHDLPRVESLLHAMFVELTVRMTDQKGLVFCLDVPDRGLGSWSIPVHEHDRIRLASDPGDCGVLIRGDSPASALDLDPFCLGLRHDWSGCEAQAFADLVRGDVASAMAALQPLTQRKDAPASAHHLLGRCHRALGNLDQAISCYCAAVRASTAPDGVLRPWAAGPLSDLGVAFKKLGAPAQAIHCFLHSLHLRPNHPEALLSCFSILALDDTYALFAAARVLAIGGHEDLVAQFLANYASFAGKPVADLTAEARKAAVRVNLVEWPFRRQGFERFDTFERGLAQSREGADSVVKVRSARWGRPGMANA